MTKPETIWFHFIDRLQRKDIYAAIELAWALHKHLERGGDVPNTTNVPIEKLSMQTLLTAFVGYFDDPDSPERKAMKI